jgi:hypothetical protein
LALLLQYVFGQCFLNLRALLSLTNSKAVTKHLITNGAAAPMTLEAAEWANQPNGLGVKWSKIQ